MAEFITKCPHCSAELQAQDEWIGMEVECPECQKTFIIPKEKKTTSKKTGSSPKITASNSIFTSSDCFWLIAILIGIPLLLYWWIDWPRTVFWCTLPLWGFCLILLYGNNKGKLAIAALAGVIWWGWHAHSSNTADSSSGGNNSATAGDIVFITDISNGYGRINPAMAMTFIVVGVEGDNLNDMIKKYYDANNLFRYKQQTQKTSTKDRLPVMDLFCEIAKYISAHPRHRYEEYLGNNGFALTGVPVGRILYCAATAQWNNGNHQMWWVKKIVVKPGKNQIIFENDYSALQINNN